MPAARRTEEPRTKPRSDTYVGILLVSLLALTAAMLFAYLNWDQVKEDPKPLPSGPPGGGAARPAPPPMQGGAVNPPPAPPAPGGAQPGQAPGNQPQPPPVPPPQPKQ